MGCKRTCFRYLQRFGVGDLTQSGITRKEEWLTESRLCAMMPFVWLLETAASHKNQTIQRFLGIVAKPGKCPLKQLYMCMYLN